jgi:hypothetical protein
MPDGLEVTARHFLWDEPSQSSLRDASSPEGGAFKHLTVYSK